MKNINDSYPVLGKVHATRTNFRVCLQDVILACRCLHQNPSFSAERTLQQFTYIDPPNRVSSSGVLGIILKQLLYTTSNTIDSTL